MWSISQPKKGPLHCSCHLSAVGETIKGFPGAALGCPFQATAKANR